jgi:hypothetical protein
MRASEFVREEREEWSHMPDPTMQKQFDVWAQEKRGRNALTTMPAPKTNSGYKLGPDSTFAPQPDPKDLLRNPAVAKELGFPRDWHKNEPSRLTRKMIDPATGNVQLGPDALVQPGTEEYAELRKKTDPVTGMIYGTGRMPVKGSQPPSQEHERRSQHEVPVQTRDQGKEWPQIDNHPKNKQYRMIDPRREKYRT